MKCKVCSCATVQVFEALVLKRYTGLYRLCPGCGYLFVEDPFWLGEAYSRAIALADTGLVSRNLNIGFRLASALQFLDGRSGRGTYLDYAGGYGLLTRFMRDFGYDFRWFDKYCENSLSAGFEFVDSADPISVVTAIEVMEHVPDPIEFINEVFAKATPESMVFTTRVYSGNGAPPANWDYYSFETGQHIGFYRRSTLNAIATRLGLKFHSSNGIHIFTKRRLSKLMFGFSTSMLTALPLSLYARYRLGSKTYSDNQIMLRRI